MNIKKRMLNTFGIAVMVSLLFTMAPAGGALMASSRPAPVRTYTFVEVGNIAQNNAHEIIRQKAAVVQAAQSKDSQLSNYQTQVYLFYSDPESGIAESSLYSLQESYENAFNSWLDAEESLAKLRPKVAWQAQKLHIDILLSEKQIQMQEMEVQRLKDEYELAKVRTLFGNFTITQQNNARTQWENAVDTLESLTIALINSKNTMREYLNLADAVEFELENPPVIGPYTKDFDGEETLMLATRNSLSLKQAQREVDDLTEKILQYEIQGQRALADRLAATGPAKDLALRETRQTLTRTVESTMRDYNGLEAALEKAKESLYTAQRDHIMVSMRQRLGVATINELRLAERAVMAAEKDRAAAEYNLYLGAKKVMLLRDGVLVN